MMKILGAGLMALAGLMAGMGKTAETRKKLCLLEDMDAALGEMAAEIEFRGRPLEEIFESLAQNGPKSCRGFFGMLAIDVGSMQELWPSAIKQLLGGDGLALAGLGAVLGRFEGERQAAEIGIARQRLKNAAQQLRTEIGEKAKNYPALGLCAGAVVGILVI